MTRQELVLLAIASADTQAALARELETTAPALSQWKHGKTAPDFRHVMALCRFTGVDPAEIDA